MKKVEFFVKSKGVAIGNRKSVSVFLTKRGSVLLEFGSKINRRDFRAGTPRPRAYALRDKNRLITGMFLSKEAANALRFLLNQLDV